MESIHSLRTASNSACSVYGMKDGRLSNLTTREDAKVLTKHIKDKTTLKENNLEAKI